MKKAAPKSKGYELWYDGWLVTPRQCYHRAHNNPKYVQYGPRLDARESHIQGVELYTLQNKPTEIW